MAGQGDYYTTGEAAKILRVTDAYVRQLLISGELEGEHDLNARWRIPAHAVHERLKERRDRTPPAALLPEAPESAQERRELRERVEALTRELGRLEGRLELTEVAESTLRDSLERERQRADEERIRAEKLEEELREARLPWWRKLLR